MEARGRQQRSQPYPPPHYDAYYPASSGPPSTDSTPPNGFIPLSINTHHASPPHSHYYPSQTQSQSHTHHAHPPSTPLSPYPNILSPTSSDSPLTDPEAELKRLRNTAASARFRAKKKRREQSLERASQEKKAQVQRLEGRVKELEEENRWLKDLVWERKEVREEKERNSKAGGEVEGEGEGKKEGDRNDGVGTNSTN